jgi:hypothetical protein
MSRQLPAADPRVSSITAPIGEARFLRLNSPGCGTAAATPIVPFELTVREVCRGCNNGWMADLETRVRPILGPMMTSSINLPLSIDEQDSLALWAAKTLMVAQSTLPRDQRVVPTEHYAELLAEQAAPTRCRIAVARRPREPEAWPYRLLEVGGEWRTKPPPGPRPTRDEFNTYRALLAVGHVVFHFLGFFDPDREEGLRPGDLPSGFIEIWPEPNHFVWSPEPEHRLHDLEPLMNPWPGGSRPSPAKVAATRRLNVDGIDDASASREL